MDTILFIHLAGAGALFALSAWTLVDLWRKQPNAVLRARALQVGAVFLGQVGSGSMLALASDSSSVLAYCSKMGLYVTLVAVVEGTLFGTLTRQVFPLQPALRMAAIALFVVSGTAIAL